MHAEHADNSELNELSGRVIGCASTVLNTLGAGSWKMSMRTRRHMKSAPPASRLCNNTAPSCTTKTSWSVSISWTC
jgi:hypothetical protein